MIVCDLDGYKVEGPEGTTQCFEVKMHSWIYKTHPEVQSVVHVASALHRRDEHPAGCAPPDVSGGRGSQSPWPIPVYPHT